MTQTQVYLRLKPAKGDACFRHYGDQQIIDVGTGQVYKFTGVFDAACDNDAVCQRLGGLRQAFADGYNVTIMAYGQSCSGKTHTMLAENGVISSFMRGLFEADGQVQVQILELYNEAIRDLLTKAQVSLFELNGDIVLKNAECLDVRDFAAFRELLAKSLANRATGQTQLNQASSRSHYLLKITQNGATLTFCDLAGSERLSKTGAEGMQLREANGINSALLTLGRVVQALSQGQKFIPYRDSKLTRILRNSLGGTALCAIIACVSSEASCQDESLCTIRFCERAMTVKGEIVKTARSTPIDSEAVSALQSEVAKLQSELSKRQQQEPPQKVDFGCQEDKLEEVYGDQFFVQGQIIEKLIRQMHRIETESRLQLVQKIESYKQYKNKESLLFKQQLQKRFDELKSLVDIEKADFQMQTDDAEKLQADGSGTQEHRRSSGISAAAGDTFAESALRELDSTVSHLSETLCAKLQDQTVLLPIGEKTLRPLTETISGTEQ